MPNSPDISKLQPGATYYVQVIPRGADINSDVGSFIKTITVPKVHSNGTKLTTTNTSLTTHVQADVDDAGALILDANGDVVGGQIIISNSVVPQVQVGTAVYHSSSAVPHTIRPGSFVKIANILFEQSFTTTPHVTLSVSNAPRGSAQLVPRVYRTLLDRFDLLIYNVNETTSVTLTGNVNVSYIAAVNVTNPAPAASALPGAITTLTAEFDSTSSSSTYIINLDWPNTTYGYYTLQQSQDNFSTTDWTITTSSSFYAASVTSSSLDPKEYYYRLDDSGTGSWSAQTSIAIGAPYSASNLVLTTIDNTTVNVTWDQRYTDGSPITFYDVYFGVSSSAENVRYFTGIEYNPRIIGGFSYVSASTNITGINAVGTYTFAIDTENNFGKSSNTSFSLPTASIAVTGIPGGVISSSATDVTIKEEGTTVTTAAKTINFVGAAVTATASGSNVTVAITGGGSNSFAYEQQTTSSAWNIAHSLGYRPAVTTIDYGGTIMEGDIVHTDANNVIISFITAEQGWAYLS